MKTARKPKTKQAEQRPAWGNWRKPTPQELELFKARWKKKHGFEPRAHEIAEFDPDWTVLRAGYEGTGQEPPIPNLGSSDGAPVSKAARKPSSRKPNRVRTPEELKIKNTLASIQEAQQDAGGCHDSDSVIRKLLMEKIPLTQKNYLELCYFGAKSSVEDLSTEEVAELPGSFFAWPVDERSVN
jgi:hypothetical protein